uniref:LRRCT domain-containing protein n=1 Tax=Electrophorus electricus TaxID=8005 RepID=A0A4W4EVL4_ELEEL
MWYCSSPALIRGDCWLIEGDKGYVWLAICSQNQPPYETIPQHINNTVHDLRLNENKLKAIFFSSLSRFTNLTELNLTKNEISYIEDGAFASQANLQVLQLGYNKLTNLTEGMLRGLGRMQFLFLQHNLIEVIATNALWECPSLSNLDLSSNKLARLDPSTFTVLGRLMVCELAGNPFHCGCELYSFLTWLEAFNNVTHTYDRLQCETPRELFGYPLLSPVGGHGRSARNILSSMCRDGVFIPGMTSLPPDSESSGIGPDMFDRIGPYHQPTTSSSSENSFSPSIKLQRVSVSSATLLVQIPRPYSKMYILVQYNTSFASDVMNLKKKKEFITLSKLEPNTNYTFCVASIRNSQRFNHTCLYFSTRAPTSDDMLPTTSTTTHYIMTIVGCLFGMLIILGLVYYCLRRHRRQEEKEKSICVKKTILEMRYGPEVAAAAGNDPTVVQKLHEQTHHQHHHGKLPSSSSSSSGLLGLGSINDGSDLGDDSDDDDRGSASEISTIAMEVDKVNQIINNCIDALKLDSVVAAVGLIPLSTSIAEACQMLSSPKIPPPPPLPLTGPLSERPGITGGSFLTPPYRPPPPATAVRPIQRQMSADAAVIVNVSKKHCGPTGGKARVYSLDVPEPRSPDPCHFSEKGNPIGCGEPLERLPLVGSSGGGQHLDVHPDFHCAEHRHSVPALYYEGSHDSPAQRVSFLKPLSRTKRDAASYSQLSPHRHNYSGYSSSPEYSSENTLRIWERFRPYRKGPREESCYITAGNALRKKVQFAKGEDLHDILDYWKGVSAQQKL